VSAQPVRPPEAELIRRRREAAVPGLSRRQAAARADISPSQWSDVERGDKQAGSGVTVPVRATAGTLARMARAVGATAEELAQAGRADAARQLQAFEEQRGLRQRIEAVPGLGATVGQQLTGSGSEQLFPIIVAGLDAIESSSLPAAAQRDLTSMFVGNLVNDATRRHAELILLLRLASVSSPGLPGGSTP
jgi:transcriptional regulator with XRE-family HTH domain